LNARVAAVLVVLLVVLGGGALFYQRQEAARRPANVAALGQRLLPDLKAADIAAIRISEPQATLTLEHREGGWAIVERAGFPADFAKVRDFVLKAIELKVGQSEAIGEQDRARLNLDQSGTQLEFKGAGGKTLAALTLGKKYFKREVDNPERAPGDGRFVMRGADPATVLIVSDPLAQASTRSADWIERTSFQVEKVKTLEVRYPDGERWRIERQRDDAGWKLAGPGASEKLDVSLANAASYSLGLLELADVAPQGVKPQDTGLDKPIRIDATTLDGLSYAIRVGKAEGDNYYVSFTSAGAVPKTRPAEKGESERMKKLEERLPREKLLSQHVLLVPKSKLEDTLKKRAGLLQKKDDRKK
jgi:hypothetical protein